MTLPNVGADARPKTRSWRPLYVAILAGGLLIIAVFGFGQVSVENFGCRSLARQTDEFLAYCESDFADYEHGALYYGSEPNLRENIRNAEVLFLGSSRLQAAFSTEAVRDFFRARGVRYFLLGFGYGEASAFAQAVMERSMAVAKLLVINADPFFINDMSPPAKEAKESTPLWWWRFALKIAFQHVQPGLCRIAHSICAEDRRSIFRSVTDGQWNWAASYIRDNSIPIGEDVKERLAPDQIERAKEVGEVFLRRIGIKRACVVMTGTPNSDLNSPEIAKVLAEALGTHSLTPDLPDLSTIDGGHLNPRSAERWSGAFLEELTPQLQRCGVTKLN
jgi:hypothetical protein